jgi:hypothetical protein
MFTNVSEFKIRNRTSSKGIGEKCGVSTEPILNQFVIICGVIEKTLQVARKRKSPVAIIAFVKLVIYK